VEAGDERSVLACFEEGLRHGALGWVVAEVAGLSMTASRRLQLAAEGSGGIAIRRCLVRRQAVPEIVKGVCHVTTLFAFARL
jgi:protein ImuA